MLMADSGATAGLRYVDPPTNRNLAINGAMQVAQRSTSVTGITTGDYVTADRWRLGISGLGTWTQSVENDAPSGSGLRKSLKMLCTTADSTPAAADVLDIGQRIEGQDLQRLKKGTSAAEQLSVSFWVKSNVTGTYIVHARDIDNSRHVSVSYSISAADTWERKTVTLPADTTGALDNDNAQSMVVLFALAAGSDFTSGTLQTTWASSTGANANRYVGQTNLAASTNNYWQVTGVQLETGPVATPFEFEPYEATLRKCQRYYYRITSENGYSDFAVGFNASTTVSTGLLTFPTRMRTRPTALEQTGTASNYAILHESGGAAARTACSSVPIFGQANSANARVTYTVASGLTAGNGAILGDNDNTTAYLAWSAEL
jgi:hypothetical protein